MQPNVLVHIAIPEETSRMDDSQQCQWDEDHQSHFKEEDEDLQEANKDRCKDPNNAKELHIAVHEEISQKDDSNDRQGDVDHPSHSR